MVKFISSIFSTFLIAIVITTTNAKAGVEEGVDVRKVQSLLTKLCYNPGPIDGAWGRRTEAAAKKIKCLRRFVASLNTKWALDFPIQKL